MGTGRLRPATGQHGDFAWVQHMVASMDPDTGRVGVVMPHGVLFPKDGGLPPSGEVYDRAYAYVREHY